MRLSNADYDILKFVVTIVLPSLATLISALGLIWEFEWTDAVVGTLVAITTFLGAVIGVSSANYKKGQ